MAEAAEAAGVQLAVQAYFSNIITYWDFEKHPFDVILIAPQVRFIMRSVAKKAEPLGIIVQVIDPVTYGMVDGAKLFHNVQEVLASRDANQPAPPI